ncbi:MAG: GTPase HflX [Rudaea sp.]|uniref:ribosome rescue GTPase HflX n=1 Tax=Rudaea sp. TaxID=2136325 RepID=UPI0039E71B73
MFERSRKGERALLLQPRRTGEPAAVRDAGDADEFGELARSAGATVVGSLAARVDKPNPKFFVGTGKADELKAQRAALDADLILVDHALSPVQERNLERHAECRVVDRTGLILDIFAQRARSHEGKLQVELAQLKHMSTRLVRGWTHLERQRGGAIGLRGPGETQLELDRRLLAARMKQLEQRLEKVETQRHTAKRARQRNAVPTAALVGYTNAGKSTLFNAVTGAGVYAADQLFATLDPTLRHMDGLACGPVLLADTVGFIRDLPHDLVAAFKSTLSETREADVLLHVVDAADPERDRRIEEVQRVLEEIGARDVPQIFIYNKIDLLADVHDGEDQKAAIPGRTSQQKQIAPRLDRLDGGHTARVWVSAVAGAGIDLLREALTAALQRDRVHGWLALPDHAGRLRARLIAGGFVRAERPAERGWEVQIDAPRALIEPLFGLPGGEGEWLRRNLETSNGRREEAHEPRSAAIPDIPIAAKAGMTAS